MTSNLGFLTINVFINTLPELTNSLPELLVTNTFDIRNTCIKLKKLYFSNETVALPLNLLTYLVNCFWYLNLRLSTLLTSVLFLQSVFIHEFLKKIFLINWFLFLKLSLELRGFGSFNFLNCFFFVK